ncbi:MAG: redoxin domain-containing protein, partial [Chloroflexota bacterium]
YTKLVAVSVDPVATVAETKKALGASFPMLSDVERTWQRQLDLVEYTDQAHNPYIPYSFLLEPGLVIYKIYNGYWFWGRPTVEDLRQDFRAISAKCRPDWDPQAAGVREVWEAARAEGIRLAPADYRRRVQEWRAAH